MVSKTAEKIRRHFHKLWWDLCLGVCDVTTMNDVIYLLLSQDLIHLSKTLTIIFVVFEVLNMCVGNVCYFQLGWLRVWLKKFRKNEYAHVVAYIEQNTFAKSLQTKHSNLDGHTHLSLPINIIGFDFSVKQVLLTIGSLAFL